MSEEESRLTANITPIVSHVIPHKSCGKAHKIRHHGLLTTLLTVPGTNDICLVELGIC